MILLENINKVYGKGEACVKALDNINLEIKSNEMVAIMGASGSGKSTLLNILGCIDKCTAGKYYLNNKDISNMTNKNLAVLRNKYFGFIIQYFALIDEYNVYQNVKVPLNYTKLNRIEKRNRIINVLGELGISEKIKKMPYEISGGQRQRVAIARALVNKPNIILADEPTGALDKKTGEDIMNIFVELNKQGKSIVIVTHNSKIADYCSRIIHLDDGKIVKLQNNKY